MPMTYEEASEFLLKTFSEALTRIDHLSPGDQGLLLTRLAGVSLAIIQDRYGPEGLQTAQEINAHFLKEMASKGNPQ